MARIAAVSTVLPPHRFSQDEVRDICRRAWADDPALLARLGIFDRSGVGHRHFAFPPEYYARPRTFEERNADYGREALSLAEAAATKVLKAAGLTPADPAHIFLVTTTGLATPSLDALLVGRLGLRRDIVRWPLFGLGCAGGAGALARAGRLLESPEADPILIVSVELCGQIFSARARTPVDLVGAALFGDGAAAVVMVPDSRDAGPRLLASETVLFESTPDMMGWRFTDDGMRLVLSREIPGLIGGPIRSAVERFLERNHVAPRDLRFWILHPGGRRVIEAAKAAFALSDADLRWTRNSLKEVGNLSSAAVLFVLRDAMKEGNPRPGDRALMCALGPGFASELLLLGWE